MIGNPVIGWNVSQGVPRRTLGKIGVRFMAETVFWELESWGNEKLHVLEPWKVTSLHLKK